MSDEWTPSERLQQLYEAQRESWRQGEFTLVETYIERQPDLRHDEKLLLDLILSEYTLRQERGEQPTAAEYLGRFPAFTKQLQLLFEVLDGIDDTNGDAFATDETQGGTVKRVARPAVDPANRASRLSADQPSMASTRFGAYELIEEIARGGMGVVYKARQSKLDRIVALKMIRADQFDSASSILRFQNEAEAAAKLDHPGVVPIFDVGDQDGQPYLSMAFIDGESLAARVARGRLESREAARIVRDVAQAIQHAHERSIVHRDLKPANILLDASDRPRVTDFGFARRVDVPIGVSLDGSVIGTPSYMSPEQAAGDMSRVGPACDIYSLGAVLFHLLTGRPPFVGANVLEIIRQVSQKPVESPRAINPSVPVSLERICLKCLAKQPEQRYATAGDVAAELDRYLQSPPDVIPPKPVSRATISRSAWLPIAVAALLLLVAFVAWRANPRPANSQAAQADTAQVSNALAEIGHAPKKEMIAAANSSSGEPQTADLNVIVGDESKSQTFDQPGALPLRTGQQLRIEATTNRPAYLYLVWIDTQGVAQPVYPWKPGHWEALTTPEKPTNRLKFPPDAGGSEWGYTVQGGAGMETLVLLARDTPLPPGVVLKDLFADLPAQPIQNGQLLVWLENGERAESGTRSLDFEKVKPLNSQSVKLKLLLEQRLKSYFPLFRAVSLANRGS
ncbi:MAG TPA: protein kinase [Planctomycetaceae bacterium]|jgi:serine/threonine protein kinase|nr:protein kinase [Planctomycetaceae bacterium]